MPHVILEYSDNLTQFNPNQALLAINQALVESSDSIQEEAIKSRAYPATHYVMGTQPENRAFIHVSLYLLQGRDISTKQRISQNVIEILQNSLTEHPYLEVQLTLNIMDMDTEVYAKRMLTF